MEPMKPHVRRSLLQDRPDVQPSDIDRYQRLLSARFEDDPDFGPAHAPAMGLLRGYNANEGELADLRQKLFGGPQEKFGGQVKHTALGEMPEEQFG